MTSIKPEELNDIVDSFDFKLKKLLVVYSISETHQDPIGVFETYKEIKNLISLREQEARKKAAFDMWLQGHDVLRDLDASQESINMLTIAYNRVTGEPIDDQFDQLKKETNA